MKKPAAVAAALLLAAALYFFLRTKTTGPSATVASGSDAPAIGSTGVGSAASTASSSKASTVASRTVVQSATPTGAPSHEAGELVVDSGPVASLPPEVALRNVGHAIQQYGQMFSGNPVGTNPEITSQLNGNNPKHVNFIDPKAGMQMNGNGELVDAWGTPYFFHQLSGTDTEIHSAGPDKVMWTSDDLVVK